MTSKELVFLLALVLGACSIEEEWSYENAVLYKQALKPRGFRIFFKGTPQTKLFLFEGTIKEPSKNDSSLLETVGEFWGYGVKQKYNNGWIYEDKNVNLKVGQYIEYRYFATNWSPSIETTDKNNNAFLRVAGYYSSTQTFYIRALEDSKAHGPHCPKTETKVRGGQACANEVIFEDNFDTLSEELWQIEQYIPIDHPEHPFVSYQRPLTSDSNSNIFVDNGTLNIVPKLQQDILKNNNSILSAKLDLTSGCTGNRCTMQASGVNILPPIVSGRLTSARFAFTYGIITIRAKLPKGDWIYPEILLEPFSKKYGNLNYDSGLLKIVLSRGNVESNSVRHTIHEISGGPIINAKCRNALEFYHKRISEGHWSDDFHEYQLEWTPEKITLDVDGVNFGTYFPGPTGLRSWLPASCRGPGYDLLKNGDTMAPFDDHFQIALGVAVGGVMEFPDGLISGGNPKPWQNRGRKVSLSFWQSQENWYPTWSQPGLVIDYVRVVALPKTN